ncbi:MAG: hypothetical protein A2651_02200 [Candidatus Yanofskybacteria bacterium RIFCSPHIGHO2_01_FULL_42_12]|uniref:HD domain-containing protein n=1 Tax=Candidatus Yanofskybacteria bacterium RIFCSPLOWO2_01_FULL_42_49 TaxID=1802694 RepID=A0A1F8GDF0_9BACT|nr:MAG: hypothetical protein A2651_02200 [Candidatus Yanofskybacteria bacterium RIFCSPHIGHO2_01_FULL_42_12]OGN22768.1 MAG: hypothetical protein A2918_01355 [Candidatus Yanofskybacteria bacterium RIFCSPLOWO2_01_FULL_42_49]
MPKEEITMLQIGVESTQDHIQELFKELGVNFEEINPNIIKKLRLLSERTETFRDEERSLGIAHALFQYYEEKLSDEKFTEDEQRTVLVGTIFTDIGKTGPRNATLEQETIILDIYNVENLIAPEKTSLLEFIHNNFPEDGEERLSAIEAIDGISRNMTMREFYNLHPRWTLEIVSGDGVPPEAVAAAATHHMLEGINPEEIVDKDGRFTKYFGDNMFFDRAEKLIIILDKYDAFRRRGGKEHKKAIELVKDKIESNPNFTGDKEFEELLNNLDTMISTNAKTYQSNK